MTPSIFDVIDNFWGKKPKSEIRKADARILSDFGVEVNRFYSAFTPPVVPVGEFRTYYGGSIAVTTGTGTSQTELLNNLLYSDGTIIPDPIARWYFDDYEHLPKTPPAVYHSGNAVADQSEWMGWIFTSYRAYRWNVEMSRQALEYLVRRINPLRPLVASGAVVLISQAHMLVECGKTVLQEALIDANSALVRAVCKAKAAEDIPLWDNVRGGIMTPGVSGIPPDPDVAQWAAAKEAAFHIRKNLAIASYAGGHYIATNDIDYDLLKELTIRSGSDSGYQNWELRVAHGVAELELPSLQRLTVQDLVVIRNYSDEFSEFRTWLSSKLFSLDTSAQQVQAKIVSQEIEAEVSKLRRKLSDSAVIKKCLKDNALKLSVQTAVGIAVGASLGRTAAVGAVGALAGIASALFCRDQERGILAQIAKLTPLPFTKKTSNGAESISEVPLPLRIPWFGQFQVGPAAQTLKGYTAADLKPMIEEMLEDQGRTQGPQFRAIRHS
jgi:hypothetical protein